MAPYHMTMLANLPLFILFYAMSPLWAKAAIYTGITIGVAKAIHLLYYAADLRSRTAIIWGVVIWLVLAGLFYRFTVWLDADMVKMLKH